MITIEIISPSVRKGRKSHRVALYLANFINEMKIGKAEVADLLDYNFPVFNERLKFQDAPSEGAVEFAERIRSADGVIIVVPEYNGGYPASLKNAVDLLIEEWRRKPVAFAPVSDGSFAGSQVITSFQFSLWKLGALTVPSLLRFPDIIDKFDENGIPADKAAADKRTAAFVKELLWMIEAKRRMQ